MNKLTALFQTHRGMVSLSYHPNTHWVWEEYDNADYQLVQDDFGTLLEVSENQMLFSLTGFYM